MTDEKIESAVESVEMETREYGVKQFNTRVREIDRDKYTKMATDMNIPQHALFTKLIDTFMKLESLEGVSEDRRAQAEELQGHLDRVISIFSDLLISTDNVKESMRNRVAEMMAEKESDMKILREKMKAMQQEKNETQHENKQLIKQKSEVEKIIAGFDELKDSLYSQINALEASIAEKDKTILCQSATIADMEQYKEQLDGFHKAIAAQEATVKEKESEIAAKEKELASKNNEIERFKLVIEVLNDKLDAKIAELAEQRSQGKDIQAMLRGEIDRHCSSISNLEVRIEGLSDEGKAMVEQTRAEQDARAAKEREVMALNEKLERQFHELQKKESLVAEFEKKIADLETVLKARGKESMELSKQIQKLTIELAAEQEAKATKERETSDLNKKIMKNAEELEKLMKNTKELEVSEKALLTQLKKEQVSIVRTEKEKVELSKKLEKQAEELGNMKKKVLELEKKMGKPVRRVSAKSSAI